MGNEKIIIGSQAKNQSENNPYKGIDPTQSLSGLQRFLDFFGLSNYTGKVQSAYDLASNQWESENALKLEDREYNSEQAQVDRLRSAGINPDLQGINGYESQIAGNQAGSLSYPESVMSEPVESLASGIMSAFQYFIPFVQGFQQIRANKISNDKNYYDSVSSVARSIYDDYLSTVRPDEKTGPDSWTAYVRSRAPFYSSLKRKSYRRDVITYLQQLESDMKERAAGYVNKSKVVESENRYIRGAGEWYRGEGDMLDMLNLYQSFSEFQHNVERARLRFQRKSSDYQSKEIDANDANNLPSINAATAAQETMLRGDSAFFNRNNKIYQAQGIDAKYRSQYNATVNKELERFFKSLNNAGLAFFIKMRMLSPGGVGDLPMDLIKLIPK